MPRTLSNGERYCLEKMRQGCLRLYGDVDVEHYYNGRWVIKTVNRGNKSKRGRYLFHVGSKVMTVFRSRLLWMLANRRAIPDGYKVDHVNGERTDDRLSNLQLQSASESHSQGNSVQIDKALEGLGRWFEFVGCHGREPEHPAELCWVEDGF